MTQEVELKFTNGVQWVRIPYGKGMPPTVSESCRCRVTTSGSVDSVYRSHVIEPRNVIYCCGLRFRCGGGSITQRRRELWQRGVAQPGSKSMARVQEDSPGSWEIREVPPETRDRGLPTQTVRAWYIRPLGDTMRHEQTMERWYSQAKATKCGWMATRKSYCGHSSVDYGEFYPRRAGGAKGHIGKV